jgi:NADPH-dependent curcumin reductase CurA
LWLSVDPAQRIWMTRDSYKPKIPLGEVMQSFAVGQVLESRHPDFKAGDLVRGDFGWQDYAATDGKTFGGIQKLPPGMPLNLALSLFGLNGLTAYFGITDIGQVKAGETAVVSSAAGAPGSIAAQIAAFGMEVIAWSQTTPHIGYVARDLYRTFFGDTVKNITRWLGDRYESDDTREE